jgi:broad specificity phosphatase PhoE
VSTLYLVRHGQASWNLPDYDQLSDLGAEQARMLGRFLSERGVKVDAIYAGPLRRQQQTARLVAQTAEYPEPILERGLEEHPTPGIIRSALPALAQEDPELARELGTDAFVSPKPFQRVFGYAMKRWADGVPCDDGVETHASFCARVDGAIERIRGEQGRGRTVMAVTSAGPVARVLQTALRLSHEVTFQLNLVVANASITELRWREQEMTVMGFNAVAHLEDRVTFR